MIEYAKLYIRQRLLIYKVNIKLILTCNGVSFLQIFYSSIYVWFDFFSLLLFFFLLEQNVR